MHVKAVDPTGSRGAPELRPPRAENLLTECLVEG